MLKEEGTIAEAWLERIDRPITKAQAAGGWNGEGIDKRAVKRMIDAAVYVLPGASGRCTDIFIFKDGSSLYEKRKDDWYPEDMFVRCEECDGWFREDVKENTDCEPLPERLTTIWSAA